MKKLATILCAVLVLTLLVGCAAKPAPETEPAETPDAADGLYLVYNGAKLALGMSFADVKDALGEETRPADEILPCDGGDSFKDTMHHYAGMDVTEDINGIVKEIDVPGVDESSEAAVLGKVKVGDKQSDAVAALGEPENYPLAEDDFALTYKTDNQYINLFLDPDNKETISGMMFMLMTP